VALCEGGVIRLEDLPTDIARIPPTFLAQRIPMPEPSQNGADLRCAEKEALLRALDKHRWNISQTSAHLGLSRNSLYRKLKKYGISKASPPSAWKS
jgi:transcriptional regulator of acetoin/glycerol metabolism